MARENFDIRKTSQEQKKGRASGTMGFVAEKAAHICVTSLHSPRRKAAQPDLGSSVAALRTLALPLVAVLLTMMSPLGGREHASWGLN
jgi:hypothetical protein